MSESSFGSRPSLTPKAKASATAAMLTPKTRLLHTCKVHQLRIQTNVFYTHATFCRHLYYSPHNGTHCCRECLSTQQVTNGHGSQKDAFLNRLTVMPLSNGTALRAHRICRWTHAVPVVSHASAGSRPLSTQCIFLANKTYSIYQPRNKKVGFNERQSIVSQVGCLWIINGAIPSWSVKNVRGVSLTEGCVYP